MPERLVVYLKAGNSNTNSALIVDDSQQIVQTFHEVGLQDLKSAAAGKSLTVIVPAKHIAWHNTQLPKSNRQRLEQAIPYALEDDCLNDINDLHFVLQEVREAPQSVVVIAKAQMQSWLAALDAAGLQADELLVDIALTDATDQQWHISIESQDCLLVLNEHTRLSCALSQLDDVLLQCLQDQRFDEPDRIQIDVHQGQAPKLKITDVLPGSVDIVCHDQPLLHQLLHAYFKNKPTNCLSGEFQTSGGQSGVGRWRQRAVLSVLICLGFLGVSESFNYWQLHQTAAHQKQQIATLYKIIFPNARSVISPKLRIQRALQAEHGGAQSSEFYMMVQSASTTFEKFPTITIKSMKYSNERLQLQLRAARLQTIQSALAKLQRHWKVELRNTTSTKTGTETEMVIT